MHVNFVYRNDVPNPKNRMLQIDNARVCYRNFGGDKDRYAAEGERNFSLIIDDEEIAQALREDFNEFGVAWNVRVKPPRKEGEEPLVYMKVKVKYTDRSAPAVYLKSGNATNRLSEADLGILDEIRIASVDMDIRPFDGESRTGAFRAAYLQSIWVTQDLSGDRFAARYAGMDEEY